MFFHKKDPTVVYRGYIIRHQYAPWGSGKLWFWQHDDAESEHDPRRGWSDTLDDAKVEIDDQIAEKVGVK